MKIGVGVFTTGERPEYLAKMQARLQGFEVHIETDPDHTGPWNPARRCLEYFLGTDVTHVLLVGDDWLPCLDFQMVIDEVVASHPSDVICPYSSSNAALDALSKGWRWYTTHNGAVIEVIPRELISEFLAFVDDQVDEKLIKAINEDGLVNLWCMATDRLVFHTAVSLLEHQNAPSLLGHDQDAWRRSLIRPFEDMLGLQWNTPAVHARLQFTTHWLLTALKHPEKYNAHEKVYALQRGLPRGT